MTESDVLKRVTVGWFAAGFVGRSASGTAFVARMTIQALLEIPERYHIVIFARNNEELLQVRSDPTLEKVEIKMMPKVNFPRFQTSIQYYKMARNSQYSVDVLHFSVARLYPFFWIFPAGKFFCTFHAAGDVTVKAHRWLFSRHVYNLVAKHYWKKLDAIIAVSEFGRNEIANNYKIPRSAIRVIPNGVDGFLDVLEIPIQELSSKKQIVVVIGRWQEYKNVHRTIRAIATSNLVEEKKIFIVTIGNSITNDCQLTEKEISKVPKNLHRHFDYLQPGELVWLYRNASVVIHPSLNEGFGLPAFEAFLEGTNLVVHAGTPADSMLNRAKGVFVCEMTDTVEIESAVNRALLVPREPRSERLEFLRERQIMWNDFKHRYQELYFEQMNY
jgi:glycosyltransferase involved in cell wall biosynthesis